MMRHGYHVNGRRFSLEQRSQAIARATFLASEYGREVPVLQVEHDGSSRVAHNARPNIEHSRTLLLAVL